jgi:hypothetical protein
VEKIDSSDTLAKGERPASLKVIESNSGIGRNKEQIAIHPDGWLPWNHRENLNEPRAGPVSEPSVNQWTT